MIPRASITAWRKVAPWPDNTHVEQDLVLSRALVELFRRPAFAEGAVFRGGTALHKLFFDPPGRYSEDIDLVQRTAGPIGPLVDEIRAALDPWLGTPKWKAGQGRFTLYYRFDTTFTPVVQMRVKIEINTREHFAVHGYATQGVEVANPWFSGHADVETFSLPELLGTKLRALYQRKKGRDLFDPRPRAEPPGVRWRPSPQSLRAIHGVLRHAGDPRAVRGEHGGEARRSCVSDRRARAAPVGPQARRCRGMGSRARNAHQPSPR